MGFFHHVFCCWCSESCLHYMFRLRSMGDQGSGSAFVGDVSSWWYSETICHESGVNRFRGDLCSLLFGLVIFNQFILFAICYYLFMEKLFCLIGSENWSFHQQELHFQIHKSIGWGECLQDHIFFCWWEWWCISGHWAWVQDIF